MGKRQHQKDKLYLTYTEWTTLYGGKASGERITEEEHAFKRLPFDHCCVSLQPWEHPYCDQDGNIFDLQAIIPFLKKFKINPVTGKPLEMKSLIKLNFYRNAENEIHCPVLFKTLTKHSHIAVIGVTGNVYSMEAVEQLNIKNKNWKDLIDDSQFERKDIIVLQDPNNLVKFNITKFHHVKNNLRVETEDELADKSDPTARLKSINPETKYTLEELNRDYKEPTIEVNKKASTEKADKFNAAHYSTGKVAASFTSTVMETQLVHEAAIIHEDLVRYERVKKKGYVRLITNFGPLNLELYCDAVPKTCENFIKHCANGYYNGTKFHRSIRNFMVSLMNEPATDGAVVIVKLNIGIKKHKGLIFKLSEKLKPYWYRKASSSSNNIQIQGGDPTNSGKGGKSIWGGKFEDEFRQNLSHTGRGVLSMANSGTNTNGAQFFITYRSCKHLDRKHTIFGKVVGGMDTLSEMERIEVDNKDRPIEDIILIRAQVFVDPYEEADEQLNKEREEELKKKREEEQAKRAKIEAQKSLTIYKNGVGKYINPNINKSSNTSNSTPDAEPDKKKKKTNSYNFNFSNW